VGPSCGLVVSVLLGEWLNVSGLPSKRLVTNKDTIPNRIGIQSLQMPPIAFEENCSPEPAPKDLVQSPSLPHTCKRPGPI